MSDHRLVYCKILGVEIPPVVYRNPRSTDIATFNSKLSLLLDNLDIPRTCETESQVEKANDLLQSAIIKAYESACPERKARSCNKTPWCKELDQLRSKTRKLFSKAKRTRL